MSKFRNFNFKESSDRGLPNTESKIVKPRKQNPKLQGTLFDTMFA